MKQMYIPLLIHQLLEVYTQGYSVKHISYKKSNNSSDGAHFSDITGLLRLDRIHGTLSVPKFIGSVI